MTLYEESELGGGNVNRGLEERLSRELREMRERGVYKELQHILGSSRPWWSSRATARS